MFLFRGSTTEVATQNIIDIQIPALKELCNSGSLSIDNIDVFCEKGVFDTDTSRRILKAGQEAGWQINFHGDELNPMNSGEVRVKGIKYVCQQHPVSTLSLSLTHTCTHVHTHTHTYTHTHTHTHIHTHTHTYSVHADSLSFT